jgi:hypothetical protein
MGWAEVVVAFASAIVGGLVGWFGHTAWQQRTTGDNSPAVKVGGNSTVTTAGRDVVNMHVGPKPTAQLVIVKIGPRNRNQYAVENRGHAEASNAVWGVDGDGTRVISARPTNLGTVSSGARFPLAHDATSFGSSDARLWVAWVNPDGSNGRSELPI